MTIKLNQLLANEKNTKNRVETTFTRIYQELSKVDLLNGFAKTYKPKEELGEQYSPEGKKVIVQAEVHIQALREELSELFDVTAQKDQTNRQASADVVLEDGTVLLKNAPATHLLWIEKKLVDLTTFIRKLPVLDQNEDWKLDSAQNLWVTDPSDSFKTKKITKHNVVTEATKEHPAQIRDDVEDVIIGTWTTRKFSGCLPQGVVTGMLKRVEALTKAVKFARAQANTTAVDDSLKSGKAILGYIFDGLKQAA
jgi:hypothetical protein